MWFSGATYETFTLRKLKNFAGALEGAPPFTKAPQGNTWKHACRFENGLTADRHAGDNDDHVNCRQPHDAT